MVSKKVTTQLEKLQGDEWDSDSDIETNDATASSTFEPSNDLVKLPSPTEAVDNKSKSKMQQTNHAGKKKDMPSNVIYLGRIPHGFYEKQMMGFFKQFGVVRRVRLSRNKRTGNSKHYAFIQFDEPEVAQIVANTMNEYRLFDHTLKCHVVPWNDVHERMFIGANKEFKPLPRQAIYRNRHNAEKSYEQIVVNNKRLVTKERQKRKVFKALGIEYDFPGYESQLPAKKQHIAFT
ncbi:fha domain-interacting nucleolar [Plasmopara halstedii]|uniref:Fha domain-interacting nucleolar n=1 Tax=Plasmopara halstedii TaxID=4781 RepID=A0A0P1ALQ8_PLAHL|nr:fha domain-interacting nucleolar [Plasmopara halstedii]CEG41640.1 fha domain-interacting nucleolar [Plasmopara halstedii]|eukprot:XP_024578009.1 fha domain-interacting nucleolar [Plasmopara halstedii]